MRTVNLNPEAFADAGGKLSLAEWCALDPDEQEALAVAGRARDERIAEFTVDAIRLLIAETAEDFRLLSLVDLAVGEKE